MNKEENVESSRLNLEVKPAPESNYYQKGKLVVLCSDRLQDYNEAFVTSRKWAMIVGPVECG